MSSLDRGRSARGPTFKLEKLHQCLIIRIKAELTGIELSF